MITLRPWHIVLLACAVLARTGTAPASAQTAAPPTNAPTATPAESAPTQTTPESGDDKTAEPTEPTVTTTDRDRDGRILTSEDVEKAIDPASFIGARPTPPEYEAISPLLRQKLIEFQRLKDRFLREQNRLLREYKGATEEDRERIRDLLRSKRDRWYEQSRRLQEQNRERLLDMRRELRNHQEVFDSARERLDDRDRVGQD